MIGRLRTLRGISNRKWAPLRISLLVVIAVLVGMPQLVTSTEIECPIGYAVEVGLGDGVIMRSCVWEKSPGVTLRVGAFELHRNDILILQSQTNQAGKLHGSFKSWDDDGELINQGSYVEGLKHGEWLETDKQGVSKTLIYIDGKSASASTPSPAQTSLNAAPEN